MGNVRRLMYNSPMATVLLVFQTITAAILTAFILIQSKGTGFGRAWGGATSFTRRGLEKIVFKATFVLSAIFIVVSLVQLAL